MTYPIGSTVWGDRLILCEVLKVQTHKSSGKVRYKIRCPNGDRYVSPDEIKGHSPPIQIGDWITDSRTSLPHRYQVTAVQDDCFEAVYGIWTTWIDKPYAQNYGTEF